MTGRGTAGSTGGSGPPPRLLQFGLDLQAIKCVVPGRFKPESKRAQGIGLGPVETSAAIPPYHDQSGLLQDAEVLGNGPEGDIGECLVNIPGAGLAVPDQPEDFPASRSGDGR